jgi:hypothetical protein
MTHPRAILFVDGENLTMRFQAASTCLRNPMICSSLYLLVLMSVILQVDGLRYLYGGTAGRGQVKVLEALIAESVADLRRRYPKTGDA